MHNSFSPEDLALLTKVVDDACAKLGCDEAQKATIAARLVAFASKGTHNYETLYAIATFQRDALRSSPFSLSEQGRPCKSSLAI